MSDELFSDSMEYSSDLPLDEQGGGKGKAFPSGGGVYLLTDGEDRFIQLAAAADLRRALGNRLGAAKSGDKDLQEPPPDPTLVRGGEESSTLIPGGEAGEAPLLQPKAGETPAPPTTAAPSTMPAPATTPNAPRRPRADLREIVRRIRWRPAHSMFEITFEYYRIARVLMPETYLKQVGFGPSWFASVDPAAGVPRFQVGKVLRSPPGVDLGPFATQADAGRFVEILEDAFDLCRYYHILQQAPGGQACAYFDMGKCPAPCNGSISMEAYRGMIGRALAFACGERQGVLAGWEAAMRSAAAARMYERAAAVKQLIERARRIEHESYRLVRPVGAFRYLVVQRGGGTTRIKPFFVRGGHIEAGAAVKLKDLAEAAGGWIETMQAEPAESLDREEASEHIWLVSHFLFKREPPGVFVAVEALGEPARLAERVREHFAAGKKEELRDLGGDLRDPTSEEVGHPQSLPHP